jgi:mono/diheme cytochrome c family protein
MAGALAGLLCAVRAHAEAGAAAGAYYTSVQAAQGAAAYKANCAQCHGAQLEGVSGPSLKGVAMKGSQTIGDIYGFVSQQMPAGAPGSLSPKTYSLIMAYLLKENGHPAGAVALTPQRAMTIKEKI